MRLTEQRGTFYLGSRSDNQEPLLYDMRDLTTHAVCVGMTGSGKTGLGIGILEEAALNDVPALIIDPKGDMTNLLLTFPDLQAASFRPWVDPDGARRRDMTLDQYAEQVANSWREGLAKAGIDGQRIARLRSSTQFTIYTPGSDVGNKISIIESLRAPDLNWDEDTELLRETISGTVSALLALAQIADTSVTGREHILMATIIERAWREGQDIDLAQLIAQIQKPPFDQLGVLPLEVFYPEKDRMTLTLAVNGLLASPSFASWLEGDALDIDSLLRTADNKNRMSIFYLAHLSDTERSFFVTLLLEHVRAWLRRQPGTPSLRALLYFDELYGFMPPHPANPPTKAPLLALLKQARAQGLGLVLATQNPVDLDYKGLSNAGTWFIGKLQTANDRRRVLEGLDTASVEAGASLDRESFDHMISNLDSREFLLNNVHESAPVLFRTRWVMSYLRGPLTRVQIRALVDANQTPAVTSTTVLAKAAAPSGSAPPPPAPEGPPSRWKQLSETPPVLPSGIQQYYMPNRVALEWAIHNAEEKGQRIIYTDKRLVYRAALMGRAAVRIDNTTHNVHEKLDVSRVLALPENDPLIAWDADPLAVQVDDLDDRPAQSALFDSLPALLGDERQVQRMEQSFSDYVYRETTLTLSRHPVLKLTARPDETESQFKRRCYKEAEEKRDAEITKLEASYKTKTSRLETSIRRETRELEQDEAELGARKREELISAGESIFNILSKRRSSRALSTASRKRRMTQQTKADVEESRDVIQDLQKQLQALLDELEFEKKQIQEKWAELSDDLDTVQIRPRKADVFVQAWGVIWMPYWDVIYNQGTQQQQISLPAFETDAG